jgi:hypothetical protein
MQANENVVALINGDNSKLPESDLNTCLALNDCPNEPASCVDAYTEIEGCECIRIDSAFFAGNYPGAAGCWPTVSDPSKGAPGGRRCHVEDPLLCQANLELHNLEIENPDDHLTTYTANIAIGSVTADFRVGCCDDNDPRGTEAEVCPPSEEAPNILMCVGFFVSNCISLVCALVFAGTASFKHGWHNLREMVTGGLGITKKVTPKEMASTVSSSSAE